MPEWPPRWLVPHRPALPSTRLGSLRASGVSSERLNDHVASPLEHPRGLRRVLSRQPGLLTDRVPRAGPLRILPNCQTADTQLTIGPRRTISGTGQGVYSGIPPGGGSQRPVHTVSLLTRVVLACRPDGVSDMVDQVLRQESGGGGSKRVRNESWSFIEHVLAN